LVAVRYNYYAIPTPNGISNADENK
jgi:hypothetical protein